MWSITCIKNSVLKIGLLVFPPKLQFQFESLTQFKIKKYSKLYIPTMVNEIKCL